MHKCMLLHDMKLTVNLTGGGLLVGVVLHERICQVFCKSNEKRKVVRGIGVYM